MGAYRKKKALGSLPGIMAFAMLVTALVLVTFADQLGLPIPSWEDIFQKAGLTDVQPTSADFSMHVIDVGQGDSILLKTENHAALVDGGTNDSGETVVSYLKGQKIEKLDYVISTHPHEDHIGGLDTVIEQMDVETVIASKPPQKLIPTTKTYTDFLQAVKNKGLKITQPKHGQTYILGDDASFTVLSLDKEYDSLNNTSIVLKFTYKNNSFLLTGDAEKEVENDLVREDPDALYATVLKLGHHGSNTSSSANFLACVKPKFAAASCGKNNSYKHPGSETVKRVKNRGISFYRTDLSGTVVFESDGDAVRARTAKSGEAA